MRTKYFVRMSWLVTGGAGYIGAHVTQALRSADMSPVVVDDLSSGHRGFVPDDVPFVESSILDEATVAKIDILGSGYKDKLLAQIPAESLPKEFGGTCQCPGGCSLSDAGPWNPSK